MVEIDVDIENLTPVTTSTFKSSDFTRFKFKCNRFTVLTVCAIATVIPLIGAALGAFKTNVAKIDQDLKNVAEVDQDIKNVDEVELEVKSSNLSYVGEAVFGVLARKHNNSRYVTWNVARGNVVGSVHYTPTNVWGNPNDPKENQDKWLPEKMAEIVARAERWVDIMSLAPPDGMFLTEFKAAIEKLADRSNATGNPIIMRILFGHSPLRPVNCDALIQSLTEDLTTDANISIWVGAWRKGLGWNHAKLIAVDGTFLHTGGHNFWHKIYLSKNPVHDLSVEFEGKRNYADCSGFFCADTHASVSEFPRGDATTFPPTFAAHEVETTTNYSGIAQGRNGERKSISLISVGLLGSIVPKDRPSNDAILAMIDSAQRIIRFVIQDLGPFTIPGTQIVLPGMTWPEAYLVAIGNAIYNRGVEIEMILTNPSTNDFGYWNGWYCGDVASEIIKSIREENSDVDQEKLRALVTENLRITYLRHDGRNHYADGTPIALHSKHIIVDDNTAYIGAQNLYSESTDLAEWGVIIDDADEVQKIKKQYFDLMWKDSYTGGDVNIEKVMDSIFIHHNDTLAEDVEMMSKLTGAVTELTESFKDRTDTATSDEISVVLEMFTKDIIVELMTAASVGGSDSQDFQSIVANWEFATAMKMMSELMEEVMDSFMEVVKRPVPEPTYREGKRWLCIFSNVADGQDDCRGVLDLFSGHHSALMLYDSTVTNPQSYYSLWADRNPLDPNYGAGLDSNPFKSDLRVNYYQDVYSHSKYPYRYCRSIDTQQYAKFLDEMDKDWWWTGLIAQPLEARFSKESQEFVSIPMIGLR